MFLLPLPLLLPPLASISLISLSDEEELELSLELDESSEELLDASGVGRLAGFAGCSSSEDESDSDDEEESLEEESLCCCLLRRWRFLLGFPLVAVAGAIVLQVKLSERFKGRTPNSSFFRISSQHLDE